MQQWFQCPGCGSSNPVGHRFCGGCGTRFQYKCLRCGGIIDPTFRFCPVCRMRLEWPEPQKTQPTPIWQRTYYEPKSIPGYGRYEPQYQEKSSSPVKYLGLILGIVLIVAGIIFAANSGSNQPSSPTPPVTSQLPIIPPTAKENKPDIVTLPEYVTQYTNEQPPCLRQSGEPVHLVNNPIAKDVSFAELKSFILQDNTDDKEYIEGVRVCGDFAEMLHNNAEQNGIQGAWVGIYFEDESVGHAINAFQTTDRGLVYIDCTGRGLEETQKEWASEKLSSCEHDSVAYIEKGKEYGVVSIDKAESLDYDFYVEYAQNWQKFDSMMDDYNNEVNAYNLALGGRTTLAEPEYSKFKAWQAKLEEQKQILLELLNKLGNCFSEPLGIVKTVDIYW